MSKYNQTSFAYVCLSKFKHFLFYSDSRHKIKMGYRSKFSGADHTSVKVRGGPGRNHEVVMELQLTKVNCIYLIHTVVTSCYEKKQPGKGCSFGESGIIRDGERVSLYYFIAV